MILLIRSAIFVYQFVVLATIKYQYHMMTIYGNFLERIILNRKQLEFNESIRKTLLLSNRKREGQFIGLCSKQMLALAYL